MRENAGNEYQGREIGSDFIIQLLATQYTEETDDFDDQYDADAETLPFGVGGYSKVGEYHGRTK